MSIYPFLIPRRKLIFTTKQEPVLLLLFNIIMRINQSMLKNDLVIDVSHSFLDEKMQSHSNSYGH